MFSIGWAGVIRAQGAGLMNISVVEGKGFTYLT